MITNRLLALIVSISTVISCYPQDVQFDFRKTSWGMSMKEVEESEGLEPKFKGINPGTKELNLVYDIAFEKRNVELYYYFDNGILSGAEYMIDWGYWQDNKANHSIDYRLHSLTSIFRSLENKGFQPFGKWYFSQGYYSNYKSFTDCQNYSTGTFTYSNENIEKLKNCLASAMRNPIIKSKAIVGMTYSTERTRTYLHLPTKDYDLEMYHSRIGWISFYSKVNNDAF